MIREGGTLMQKSINPLVKNIELSGIRKIANMLVDHPDAINLTIGEPDFATPEPIKRAAIQAICQNQTGYSSNAGLLELRQVVADYFRSEFDAMYNPQTEIIITTGASEAMDVAFRTILEPGDEVIIPAPIYTGYEPLITLSGGIPVLLDTTKSEFLPDPIAIEQLITHKTKAIVFNYPSNPTGVTMSTSHMDAIATMLQRHNIFIVSDEIYSENTFNGKYRSFAHYANLKEQLILIHGLSKSHAMTGWRIGFLLCPAHLCGHALKVHAYNTICASVPSQYAAIVALTECLKTPQDMNPSYIERRNYVYNRLINMKLPTVLPNGAFYIFPNIGEFNMTSEQFAHLLLDEANVAVVPGSAFTQYGEWHIRISYAYPLEQLREAMDRLEQWVVNWRNTERHIVPNDPLV